MLRVESWGGYERYERLRTLTYKKLTA